MSITAEAPDIETSSDAYARRFAGAAGAFMLARQQTLVEALLADKQDMEVLDVGGGHAQLAGPLAAAGHRVTVLGSDERCRARIARDPRNADISFVTGPLHRLPFPDNSFDTVIAIRLMAHVEDWRRLLGEMARVARSSLMIDLPVWGSSNALSAFSFGMKKRIEGDTRRYRSFWGPEVGRELVRHRMRVVARRGQFVLPMALHRKTQGSAALRRAETVFDRMGISNAIGNPVLLRADTIE